MSSAMYDREFHVVPDIPLTPGKGRFAALLLMRDAALRAFDRAMSVPRSAIRWAIGLFHRWVEATGSAGVLSWLGGQARNAASLIREAGIVPSLFAALSTPPIPAAAAQAARFVGRGIVRVAKAACAGIKALLGRCGTTGVQITDTLTNAGTRVAETVRAVARHPLMTPVVHALRATLALVHPVSSGFVTHRLLQALIPVVWFRLVFEFLLMPFLIDTNLVGNVRDWATTQPASADPTTTDDTQGTDDAEGDLLINTFGTPIPMPTGTVPSEYAEQADVAEQGGDTEQADEEPADEDQHLNRASRRAQQREDAHAWHMQHPRR
jgi:hypothetical protein